MAMKPMESSPMRTPRRILLADDTAIVRQSVKRLLEREGFEVVGEAADGREAVELAQALHPDVAVLDLAMPELNGLDAARAIRHLCPWMHLIFLSMHIEDYQVFTALETGARGYVTKAEAVENLAHAIREVSCGRTFLSPSASRAVSGMYPSRVDCPMLADRSGEACAICGFCPSTDE
jgi:two-component system, NarL family, response regulator NreC